MEIQGKPGNMNNVGTEKRSQYGTGSSEYVKETEGSGKIGSK